MSLKINTNIAALNAHRNMLKTDSGLSKSLERLSSGLRINKAADDASGMAIADSLKAQALGLGQAIANANDAVSVIQTADGALEESINIVNTIRTKALQAASDGQNSDSRAAIQRDINKLLGSLNNIADTTTFNGQTLLKGDFQNKFFQVGAYANQTINVSIANADASHVGRLATKTTTADSGSNLDVLKSDYLAANTAPNTGDWAGPASNGVTLGGIDLSGYLNAQGSSQLSAEGLAESVNAVSGTTGVTATAETEWVGGASVTAGNISSGGIIINGVNIGAVTVKTNDADGSLVAAINAKTGSTGVSAATNASGVLTLTAADGRNIAISGTTDLNILDNDNNFKDNSSVVSIVGATDSSGSNTLTIDGVKFTYDNTASAETTADNIYSALVGAGLDSDYTLTKDTANAGVIITRIDGLDINIQDDSDNATTGAPTVHYGLDVDTTDSTGGTTSANGAVYNNSYHGQVALSSSDTISFGGDTSTLATYGLNNTPASATGGIIDADVTSFSAAQITVQRADSALISLDTIRSQLGSTQNQVESTISNISVTQVNITSSESGIRDVDFAAESANFAKFQVLAQSGSFAMAQANASLQNVLRLLQ